MGKGVFTLDTILRMVHDLKKDGKVIGFTHGAFDLFHIGHLDLLQQSARKCDFLIVGIDSDDKVSKYKGIGRPIITENERMKIVTSFEPVGAAFVKDTELTIRDHVALYREVKPDFVSIGEDYGFEGNVKEQTVRAKTKLEKIAHGYSLSRTSTIIDRIIERYAKETVKEKII